MRWAESTTYPRIFALCGLCWCRRLWLWSYCRLLLLLHSRLSSTYDSKDTCQYSHLEGGINLDFRVCFCHRKEELGPPPPSMGFASSSSNHQSEVDRGFGTSLLDIQANRLLPDVGSQAGTHWATPTGNHRHPCGSFVQPWQMLPFVVACSSPVKRYS